MLQCRGKHSTGHTQYETVAERWVFVANNGPLVGVEARANGLVPGAQSTPPPDNEKGPVS